MLSLTGVRAGPLQQAGEARTDDYIAALASLNAAAWQRLFDENFPKIYRFAYARTGDANVAEEVAAETFLAAARGIGRFRFTGAPISAWLYRIARNLTVDQLEDRGKRRAVSLDGLEAEAAGWAAGVEDAADISRCLALLTREQQEVITLRFFSDCSLQETAGALGKSVGSVKLLQHRALKSLRKHLSPEAK